MPHILDRPVWNSLYTRHSPFAIGGDFARRFKPDIGSLASARDDSPQSLAELAELIPVDGTLILLQADPIVLPSNVRAVSTGAGVQMVAEFFKPLPDKFGNRIQPLDKDDWPEMLELALLTKPGPFAIGTPKLGEFWGIKEKGRLLAMAGERMKHYGYAEVSGVCAHPDARGRGFGRALSAFVASKIISRGETPYLHSYAENTNAIRLYESLGFRLRAPMHVAVLSRK